MFPSFHQTGLANRACYFSGEGETLKTKVALEMPWPDEFVMVHATYLCYRFILPCRFGRLTCSPRLVCPASVASVLENNCAWHMVLALPVWGLQWQSLDFCTQMLCDVHVHDVLLFCHDRSGQRCEFTACGYRCWPEVPVCVAGRQAFSMQRTK